MSRTATGRDAAPRGPRRRAPVWPAGVLAALCLAGCTPLTQYVHNGFKVGPNYGRPPAPVAEHWIDADDVRVRADADDPSQWWTAFHDPVLNALVCRAYQQNLTLRQAGFRVLQARDQLGVARGLFFPQQQIMTGGFQQKEVSLEVANRQATPQRSFGTWAYGFGLAWELDFWGRFRRSIEAADDALDASVENYDDVLVTLVGDVASTYVQIRAFEQQLAYVRANIELQRTALQIAQANFKGGRSTELDVFQATSNLSQTEALVPALEVSLRQATDRLCFLLGIPAEELRAMLGPGPIPAAPPDVAVGVPADLLRRRPDVRRAERTAAAQCAQIGVAEADFYPAVTVTGQIGWAAQDLSRLFTEKAFAGNVGPSFQWNILNYGRILNNVRLQDARFQELIAAYQNTVLNADKEVEDGLVVFLRAHQQARSLQESVDAAQKAVKLALAQYEGGLVDFNRVALLEQNLVVQQNDLAQAQSNIALGLIQVYRALGGGWQIRLTGCSPGDPAPEKTPAPKADEEEAP